MLAALGLLTACQVLGVFGGGGGGGPVFPHAVHMDEGMDCSQCHAGAEDAAVAGFPPTEKGCMLCHKELDADKPFEKTVQAFLVDGKPRWLSRPSPYTGDIRFDHGVHYDAELDCESCHVSQTGGEGADIAIHGGKPACQECHARTERGNQCSVCHEKLRRDVAPADHRGSWDRLHGDHAHDRIAGTGETTCAQCHQESSCTQCHQHQMPRSHTNFWRKRGHGLTAAIDRDACDTCHTPDYCIRCHRSTQPLSHRGAFGPPRNRHCVTCHLPSTGLGCGVCHDRFPLHPQGTPLPGNAAHLTARSPVDCLTCHVALSHPNPGGDCRFCHR